MKPIYLYSTVHWDGITTDPNDPHLGMYKNMVVFDPRRYQIASNTHEKYGPVSFFWDKTTVELVNDEPPYCTIKATGVNVFVKQQCTKRHRLMFKFDANHGFKHYLEEAQKEHPESTVQELLPFVDKKIHENTGMVMTPLGVTITDSEGHAVKDYNEREPDMKITDLVDAVNGDMLYYLYHKNFFSVLNIYNSDGQRSCDELGNWPLIYLNFKKGMVFWENMIEGTNNIGNELIIKIENK